jgi:hypothetical protein
LNSSQLHLTQPCAKLSWNAKSPDRNPLIYQFLFENEAHAPDWRPGEKGFFKHIQKILSAVKKIFKPEAQKKIRQTSKMSR